jgi:hypothetical protein
MHPGSTTPKDKVERHSLTDGGLKGIYERYKDLADVGGGSAKDVGTGRAATDAINGGPASQAATRDWAQKDFKIKQGLQQTQFTGDLTGNSGGLGYARVGLSHSNTKYAPSGRL